MTADLTKLKYDIESHLGDEIIKFCRKEGFKLVTSSSDGEGEVENNDQNITFIQYYLKEFQVPEVSADLVFKYLHAMLTDKAEYSTLFSNLINVEKLFASMILVLGHCVKNIEMPKSQENVVDQLLSVNA